ncbi:hypothetical protein DL95DRAFT_418410 [Leptodontidium sp. 2 PMI_412]|nr:hypothetical protein BKA61DRAFT_580679 [Leptodontidium sp. MPI-SDFR-AT-0119]KAH9204240.1 hypothetical protein DL95DRAFT_418410 [Leptodontidium sp. 2 PMI_412]
MEERTTTSRAKFKATYMIMLSGLRCFEDAQQKDFGASLSHQHTVHEYEALIFNCVCDLVKEVHELRARVGAGSKKQKSPKGSVANKSPKKVSKRSLNVESGRRRSSRIKQALTPPSDSDLQSVRFTGSFAGPVVDNWGIGPPPPGNAAPLGKEH